MEERQTNSDPEMRSRFQGLRNVITFNWPYYALGAAILFIFIITNKIFGIPGNLATVFAVGVVLALVVISLMVTFYVYDLSGLYELQWLNVATPKNACRIVNVTAGFDETSVLLAERFGNCELAVFDFFDPARHTEPSIRRARNAYPPFPGTQITSTGNLPFENGSAQLLVAFLAAHEIRDRNERASFFKELGRVVSPNGKVVVVEHLRDTANFLAYNIGAFHFHSRAEWLGTFHGAGLNIEYESKVTPFISVFFLTKIGT